VTWSFSVASFSRLWAIGVENVVLKDTACISQVSIERWLTTNFQMFLTKTGPQEGGKDTRGAEDVGIDKVHHGVILLITSGVEVVLQR
jgi:hypothetical protein